MTAAVESELEELATILDNLGITPEAIQQAIAMKGEQYAADAIKDLIGLHSEAKDKGLLGKVQEVLETLPAPSAFKLLRGNATEMHELGSHTTVLINGPGKPATLEPLGDTMSPSATMNVIDAFIQEVGKADQKMADHSHQFMAPPTSPKMQFPANVPSHIQSDAEYTWKEPQITCPNCGSICNGLRDAQETLPPAHPTKFNQVPTVAPVTGEQLGPTVLTWRASPCGCQVSVEWAGAYAAEVQHRKLGRPPRPVVAMTPEAMEKKKEGLEKSIAKLMTLLEVPFTSDKEITRIEHDLVVQVDALMKLCPGAHNKKKIPAVALTQDTLAWASKNKLALPPSKHAISEEEILKVLATNHSTEQWADGYEPGKAVDPSKINQKLGQTGKMLGAIAKNLGIDVDQEVDDLLEHLEGKPQKKPKLNKPTMKPTLQTLPQGPPPGQHKPHVNNQGQLTPAPGLTGIVATGAHEVAITMPIGAKLPKVGDVVVDEKNKPIGVVMGISEDSQGQPVVAIMPQQPAMSPSGHVPPLSQTKCPPKLSDVVPEELVEAVGDDLKVLAKQIQQNIVDYQEKGTPLSEQALHFLEEFKKGGGILPVLGPDKARQAAIQEQQRERILRDLENPSRMKISRIRKKPPKR
jgi:hypothetical protein